ncbi:MAG: GNAT family N-acetyltransferase [Clostridiales bacterium]|nr:GNAT family N-acetyltransferase [Clostridiales bacterium]
MNNNKYPRLSFKDIKIDDAQFFFELYNDKDVMKYIPNSEKKLEDVIKIIERIIADRESEDRTSYLFVVFDNLINKSVGIVNIKILFIRDERKCILGYMFKKEYWGRGYATEAGLKMIKYGFEVLKLSCITASVATEHRESEKVLNKIGMKKVQIVKDGLEISSKKYDEVIYEI